MTALDLAPDLPRWVEARAMLLAGAPAHAAGAGYVVEAPEAQLAVVLGDAPAAAVLDIVRSGAVLFAIERADLSRELVARGFEVARATLHTLPDPDALPDDAGVAHLPGDAHLGHLLPLAEELRRVKAPIHAAYVDGEPVSFAYAPWRTERWFDVSVDTLSSARQLGLATRTAAAMIRAERALGREPVGNAADDNHASLRLAARLGFTAVDAIHVATAP